MDDIIKIKKPKNWYVITLIVLCVILLLACGYFVWDKYFNKTSDNTTTETTQTATTTTTEETATTTTTTTGETASFNTFVSNFYYFTAKFPQSWTQTINEDMQAEYITNNSNSNEIITFLQGNYNTDDLTSCLRSYIGDDFNASYATTHNLTNGTKGVVYQGKVGQNNEKLAMFLYPDNLIPKFPGTTNPVLIINTKYTSSAISTSNDKTFLDLINSIVFDQTADLKAATSITTNFTKDANDYHGTLVLTGYLTTAEVSADPYDETSTAKKTYASFVYTSSSTNLIDQYLNENSGNSFVGNKSIGLGCYDSTTKTIESVNMGDAGSATNIISGSNLTTLLASNANNQVKLALTKPVLTGGSGAPVCYSHFRDFELVK